MGKNQRLVVGLAAAGVSTLLAVSLYSIVTRRKKKREASKAELYDTIFVLGGPGAGKGTQCERLVKDFGYKHLSAGDLLRAERKSGGDVADMINEHIREGKIVPAAVTVQLLRTAMEESSTNKFLIDGFPRDPENLRVWNEMMSSVSKVRCLLFLDCSEEVMTGRLMKRGESSGRDDDNAESIKKRFVTYNESTMPIINHFEEEGKARRVNADQSIDQVYRDVCSILGEQAQ